ncbi:MAG: cytochrome c peroxidase [Pseudomonadota bacterium]
MKSTFRITLAASLLAMTFTAVAADKYPKLGTLPPPPIPKDNPNTPAKVALGKKLFWDNRLSGDNSMPCVSCHLPALGWGDGGQISRGYPGTKHWRNSQTVLNSAYYNKLFWEGNVTSLEQQAPAAAGGGVAGNGDNSVMEMRLRFLPEYVTEFKQVFGTEWPRIHDAWRAIAAYERTVITDAKKVPFDRYAKGDKKALNASQLKGMALYNGKAGCIQCHNGPLASNQGLYATGVPEHPQFKEDPLGQVTHRWEVYQKGVPEDKYRTADGDHGMYYVTKNPKDIGKFRVPSLRELKYTAPYMHNGMLVTLADVVEFYNQGGGTAANKTPLLKPLSLSAQEKKDLVAFLEALSMDEPLIHDDPKLPGDYQPLPAPVMAIK